MVCLISHYGVDDHLFINHCVTFLPWDHHLSIYKSLSEKNDQMTEWSHWPPGAETQLRSRPPVASALPKPTSCSPSPWPTSSGPNRHQSPARPRDSTHTRICAPGLLFPYKGYIIFCFSELVNWTSHMVNYMHKLVTDLLPQFMDIKMLRFSGEICSSQNHITMKNKVIVKVTFSHILIIKKFRLRILQILNNKFNYILNKIYYKSIIGLKTLKLCPEMNMPLQY